MPGENPCESETCRVVEGYEIGVIEPETTWTAVLNTVFVYISSNKIVE
jgi:hypothetical protein